ncbi:MAG: type II toxin-antitoxin system RelB/DinJ family antitoxin [Clostridiales bacterium]|nr:type II toxin-antitoxin system RelB/DinJ family antitoxin [Clostridiales bacterium]
MISNIYARIEPNIKEQTEVVPEKLGIPTSNAVSIFLRQVVMQNGLPF